MPVARSTLSHEMCWVKIWVWSFRQMAGFVPWVLPSDMLEYLPTQMEKKHEKGAIQ
jgi:hypothetical protein